jgi:AbrB family looped-hinge helix DNA binding protein
LGFPIDVASRAEYYFSRKVKKGRSMQSSLSSKCQVTIPKEARERLKIGPGDRVKFFFDAHGKLVILPKMPASALRGIVKSPLDKPVSLEEMEEGIAAGATARYWRMLEQGDDDGA